MGGRAAFRVDQGGRAECRTHLEFLLGHKVLHAPNDLDGGPVVLPQPAVEKGEEEGGHPTPASVRGLQAAHLSPLHTAGPLQEQGECSASQDGDLQAHVLLAGGEAEASRLLINGAPEGPWPCSSLRSGIGVRVLCWQWPCPLPTVQPHRLLSTLRPSSSSPVQWGGGISG